MLASYLNASRFQNTAAAIYGASLVFTAAVVSLMWLSVSLRRQRVASQLGHVTAQRLTLRILMAPALYAVGLGISLLNVVVGISCYVAIALLQLVLLRPSVLNQATTEESAENS